MTQTEQRHDVVARDNRLPSLTGLRFLAALAVFGFHLHVQDVFASDSVDRVLSTAFDQGGNGVGFFFILSGFVLTWSFRPGATARRIWRRRAAKIFPIHVVTWTIALVGLLYASSHDISVSAALASLLLLQAWSPDVETFFAVNTPAWSLSCEVAFYAAFPLLIRLVRRVRDRALWPLAGLLALSIAAVPIVALPMENDLAYWFTYVLPATRALEFVLGMVLARIVLSGRWIGVGLWHALALLGLGYLASQFLPDQFAYVGGIFLPLALLIPAAAVADIEGRPSPWRNRTWMWLGEISYAFYLLHQLVIRTVDKVTGDRPWATVPGVMLVTVMLALSVLGAYVLYRFVERPMMRILTTPRQRPVPMLEHPDSRPGAP